MSFSIYGNCCYLAQRYKLFCNYAQIHAFFNDYIHLNFIILTFLFVYRDILLSILSLSALSAPTLSCTFPTCTLVLLSCVLKSGFSTLSMSDYSCCLSCGTVNEIRLAWYNIHAALVVSHHMECFSKDSCLDECGLTCYT